MQWLTARMPRSLVEHHDVHGNSAELCLKQRTMGRKDPVSLDRHDLGYRSRKQEPPSDQDLKARFERRGSVHNDEGGREKPVRCNSIDNLYSDLERPRGPIPGLDMGGDKSATATLPTLPLQLAANSFAAPSGESSENSDDGDDDPTPVQEDHDHDHL